tara:strand:+ start:39 stop:800 length:762 start_codon:yes stop_codon:yes gene_type:complete
MKKLLLLLIIPLLSLTQTQIYSSDGVSTIRVPAILDALLGYPTFEEINSKAIDSYNEATKLVERFFKKEDEGLLYKAIDYYIQAINYDDKFVQAYDNLGKIYRMLGNYKLAQSAYEISIKIFPNGEVAHQNLAICYLNLEQLSKAIEEYKTLIKIRPENPEGYYGLGNCYKRQKKYELALIEATHALELYIKNPPNYIGDGYWLVGEILYYLDEKDLATEMLQLSISIDAGNEIFTTFNSNYRKKILKDLNIL